MCSAKKVDVIPVMPIISISISYLSCMPSTVSLIIRTTSSSRRAFLYLTGKTM